MKAPAYRLVTSARSSPITLVAADLDEWLRRKDEFSLFAAATTRSIPITLNGQSGTMGIVPLRILARLIECGSALPGQLDDRPGVTEHAIRQNVQRLRDLIDPDAKLIVSVAGGRLEWSPPPGFTYCLILPDTDRDHPPPQSQGSPLSSDLILEPKRPARLVDSVYHEATWFVLIEMDVEVARRRQDVVRSLTMNVEKSATGEIANDFSYNASELGPEWDFDSLLPGYRFPSPCFESWSVCFVLPRSVEPTMVTLVVRFVGGERIAFELPVKKVPHPSPPK